jgi:cytochrome c556
MFTRLIVLFVVSGAPMGVAAAASPHDPSGVSGPDAVSARQAGMDMSSITLRTMAEAIKAGREPKVVGYPAAALAKWAKVVPRMFPPGTGKDQMPESTQALMSIWRDPAGFDRVAANYAAATAQLAVLAKANDSKAFTRQLVVVDQACRSCHTHYKEGMLAPPLDMTSH